MCYYAGICFMDAVLNHVSNMFNTQISKKTISNLQEFIADNEYDSDAFIEDLKNVIIGNTELNATISNLCIVCDDRNIISCIKDYLKYRTCMYIFGLFHFQHCM